MNLKTAKIYVAGATGMVGRAIIRHLKNSGYANLVYQNSQELNLISQSQVEKFFAREKPEIIIHAAGKVGGIFANNTYRADFLYNNLMMEANVIHAAFEYHAQKLIFLGSSCVYPKFAVQPIKEEELLTSALEPTNEPYAIAKIAGIKLCENYFRQYGCNFFSLMPTNLYGAGDHFDVQNSHVLPALIHKIHQAKLYNSPCVTLWGTGTPRREFMYVDDLAAVVVFLLENINSEDIYRQNISHINVGTGEDLEIRELAELIKELVGYRGAIEFDATNPDGMPRKLLDVTRLNQFGWKHKTNLKDGLRQTYEWFLQDYPFEN